MKYHLHYVGSKLYPKEIFIKEAQTLGVNRCLPLRMIKKLKWGDRILLGTYIPKQIEICQTCKGTGICNYGKIYGKFPCPRCNGKIDKRKNKKDGTAKVFGYFIVTGLNYTASAEFKKKLVSQLDIVTSSEPNLKVSRRCGGYTIGTSYIVKNSIKDIIEKAKELNKTEMNEQIKFFVGGRFYSFVTTFSPINFSRTLIEVETKFEDITITPEPKIKKEIAYIYDYSKRSYIKKYAKRGRPKKEIENE